MQKARQQVQATAPTHASREQHRTRNNAVTPAHLAVCYTGNQATLRRLSRTTPHVQCKLQIGAVNDPLEAEADRVADQVMRMPEPNVSIATAPPQVSRKCAGCEEEDDNKLHAKPEGSALPGEAPSIVHDVLRSPGQTLDPKTRSHFEARFGIDFSRVLIHADGRAGESASSVGAQAFTVGQHVIFGRDRFAPATRDGRQLIAHELVHVLQQREGLSQSIQRQEQGDAGAPDPTRPRQVACVVRLGGCASSRDGGLPSSEDIASYNNRCRAETSYGGPDVTPTDAECASPQGSALTTGEQIILGALIVTAVVGTVVLIILSDGAAAPVVLAGVEGAAPVVAGTEIAVGTAVVGTEAATSAVVAGEVATGGLVTAAETIAGGLVRAGGMLARVLQAIEANWISATPTNAMAALSAIRAAVNTLGLEVGVASVGANGTIVLSNVGGVITTILANGAVIITRDGVVLLKLIP